MQMGAPAHGRFVRGVYQNMKILRDPEDCSGEEWMPIMDCTSVRSQNYPILGLAVSDCMRRMFLVDITGDMTVFWGGYRF